MKYFVTGATGFIGSAVATALREQGHDVVGLARSDAAAASLHDAGVEVLAGSLDDLDVLAAGARSCDGVVHLGYVHDWSRMEQAIATDYAAVAAMGEALEGTDKPLVIAGGTLALVFARSVPIVGRPGREDDIPDLLVGRVASEQLAVDLAARGVRSSVVRLAPSVHGTSDHGFVPRLIDVAREKGYSAYVADGDNRWPAIHRLDAAALFCAAALRAPAGSRLHGVGDEGIAFRDIATAIGAGLDLPVRSIDPADAAAHFGFLGQLVQLDNWCTSDATQALLDWRPQGPGLLADLAAGHYFSSGAGSPAAAS